MKKLNLIFLILLFIVIDIQGQDRKEYMVLKTHDTCFCESLHAGGKIKCINNNVEKKYKYKEILFYSRMIRNKYITFCVSDDGVYRTELKMQNDKFIMSEYTNTSQYGGFVIKYHFYDLNHKRLDQVSLNNNDLYKFIQKYFGDCESFNEDILEFKNAAEKFGTPIDEINKLIDKYNQKCK